MRVLATPGHTFSHLSYVLGDGRPARPAVFTGGSLLYGARGARTCSAPPHTDDAGPRPARARRAGWPPAAATTPRCFPTHGFGSFCSATQITESVVHDRRRRRSNLALTQDEDALRRGPARGPGRLPRLLRAHGPGQRRRPAALELPCPRRVDPAELRRRIPVPGEWVVDLRAAWVALRGGRVTCRAALNFGLEGRLRDRSREWLISWGTPLSLVANTVGRRRGRRCSGPAAASASTWPRRGTRPGDPLLLGWRTAQLPSSGSAFAELAAGTCGWASARWCSTCVGTHERRAGRDHWTWHHPHVPVHELPQPPRTSCPVDRTIWVHCAAGYRASIAAGLLERAGRHVVLIDDVIVSVVTSGPRRGAALA